MKICQINEGDMSLFSSLNLQIAMLKADGEYADGETIDTPAADIRTENGTA